MRSIQAIRSFGDPSAERDDLERFFVSTPVFETLLGGHRHVVLGRKGAGKTALYRAVLRQAQAQSAIAAGLTFKTYPWRVHAAYADTSGDRWERFQAPWRFLIYVSIAALLIKAADAEEASFSIAPAKDSLKNLRRFLKNHYGSMDFNYKKAFPKGGFTIDGINVAPAVTGTDGVGGTPGSIGVRRSGLQHGDTIERLNEWLWTNIEPLAAESPPVFVLFDELDSGFDPESADYVDRVVGLLLAVRQLAFQFSRAQAPFHPIAFLRTDIYEHLKFGDKNKLTEEDAVHLVWHSRLDDIGNSLKKLIDWRIRKVMEIDDTIDNAWAIAFDGQVMRGTQHKFNHMTSRSYLRPRDIIQFANYSLKAAKDRLKLHPASAEIIQNQDIIDARDSYSPWFLKELDDEFGEVDSNWQVYLEIIRRIHYTKFTLSAFREAYKRTADAEDLANSAEQTLRFFYNASIVGFQRYAGASGGEFHFRYLDERIRLNPTARGFQVHPALKETLDLKDTADPVGAVAW